MNRLLPHERVNDANPEKGLNAIDSKTEYLRLSFLDLYIRKQTNPYHSNRIAEAEVKSLYIQSEMHKISLNDQLENFYNKCKSNRFFKHEVAYFFHAEHLTDDELRKYQTRFQKLIFDQYDSQIAKDSLRRRINKTTAEFDERQSEMRFIKLLIGKEMIGDDLTPDVLAAKLSLSRISEYRLYGGIRATLVFNPLLGLPDKKELKRLCKNIQPMMFTQLWRNWDPIKLPITTLEIDVIGSEEYTFLDYKDYDISFPSIGKSEFNNQNQMTKRFHSQTSSSWFSSLTPSYNMSFNYDKKSYATISRK